MNTLRPLAVGMAAALMLLLSSSAARSDDPVSTAVRFNREIVRIFDRKCVACHGPDAMAMSLATYRDARPWARAIREEIVEQRMPPWSAARGYARLKDDIALTPRELSTILTWVDGGVPRGDESDLPVHAARPAAVPQPDRLVTLPPQQVPGNQEDAIRRVTVETGLLTDRWVRQVQIRPGDRRLLRAAFVSIVADGQTPVWAGSWTPWQTDVSPAAPGAFFVRRGSRLSIELHYRGQDAPAMDASSIGLFFAPDGEWRAMTSLAIGRAGAARTGASGSRRDETTLAHDALVWGVRIEVPVEGPSVEVTSRRPDGVVEVLLWVPKARTDWPAPFVFEQPVRLPAGAVISATTSGAAGVTLTLHPIN